MTRATLKNASDRPAEITKDREAPLGIVNAHVRIARPSSDLAAIRRFYVDGLGMTVLYEGTAQVGDRHWELMMCGFEHASWHVEFTHSEPHVIVPSPTVDDLLVLYLGDLVSVGHFSTALEEQGGTVVCPDNPYWDEGGVTIMDPDGYRLVLTARTWNDGAL